MKVKILALILSILVFANYSNATEFQITGMDADNQVEVFTFSDDTAIETCFQFVRYVILRWVKPKFHALQWLLCENTEQPFDILFLTQAQMSKMMFLVRHDDKSRPVPDNQD